MVAVALVAWAEPRDRERGGTGGTGGCVFGCGGSGGTAGLGGTGGAVAAVASAARAAPAARAALAAIPALLGRAALSPHPQLHAYARPRHRGHSRRLRRAYQSVSLGMPVPGSAQRWVSGESCADSNAEYDSVNGVHASFSAIPCGSGARAQNECPNWPSNQAVISGCLQAMWDEGPEDGNPNTVNGHYETMATSTYARVACGFFTTPSGTVWGVQNFD